MSILDLYHEDGYLIDKVSLAKLQVNFKLYFFRKIKKLRKKKRRIDLELRTFLKGLKPNFWTGYKCGVDF